MKLVFALPLVPLHRTIDRSRPWPLFAFERPGAPPGWSDPRAPLRWILLAVILVAAALLLVRRRVLALAPTSWLASFAIVGQLVIPIGACRDVRLAYGMLAALAIAVGWLAVRVRHVPETDARRRPDDAGLLMRLGGLYEHAGRVGDAGRALTRTAAITPPPSGSTSARSSFSPRTRWRSSRSGA